MPQPTPPSPAQLAHPLQQPADLDPLLARIGDARYVLLGEASHGTHEYYRWRAEITKRLVEVHGFTFVAVEGNWPDCFQINRWVRHMDEDEDRTAAEVLEGFRRWPTWMWANQEVTELAQWMRQHNGGRDMTQQVGFYGFDVYSLWDSLRSVMDYLEEHEPDSVETARQAFRCFEPYREDPQAYAWATRMVPESCEAEVVALLGCPLLVFPPGPPAGWLGDFRPHRAIGVVYDPGRERLGNYVPTVLASRYDALLSFDHTAALRPLSAEAPAATEELEAFPSGV